MVCNKSLIKYIYNMMKRVLSIVTLAAALMLTGCMSYKNVPYIQNSAEVDLSKAKGLYDAKIMPKDQFTITVNDPLDADAVRMFNLVVQSSRESSTSVNANYLTTQSALIVYTVDNEGYINFPILGRIKAGGMTKFQLEDYIADQIYPKYVKERPLVVVNYTNFKISVVGEVNASGQYTISNGKVNIFEALAMARDMTIWGRRDNVKVIRESALGEKAIMELNLNDANIINSPYYQLQQNDIVYVTPNKTKAKNSGVGSETSLWFTSTSILVSLASLLYNILK